MPYLDEDVVNSLQKLVSNTFSTSFPRLRDERERDDPGNEAVTLLERVVSPC